MVPELNVAHQLTFFNPPGIAVVTGISTPAANTLSLKPTGASVNHAPALNTVVLLPQDVFHVIVPSGTVVVKALEVIVWFVIDNVVPVLGVGVCTLITDVNQM